MSDVIRINKKGLKLLLEKKRNSIVTLSFRNILVDGITLLSLIVALTQLDRESFWFWVLFAAFIVCLCLTFWSISFSAKNRYSAQQLYTDITGIGLNEHMFNLLIVRNREKKVLTIWDQRWGMWLFPYKKAVSAEEGNEADLVETKAVRDYFADLTSAARSQTECILKFQEYTSKYSVSDKVHKVYYHRFFQVETDGLPETEEFEISGNRFRWWNISDLEVDPKTTANNAEIVATVKNRIL